MNGQGLDVDRKEKPGMRIVGNTTKSPAKIDRDRDQTMLVPRVNGHLEPGPKKKNWELTKLQAVHHEILRLKLSGLKNTQIAKLLNVTPATVNYTCSSSLGRQKLGLMQSARDSNAIDWTRDINSLLPQCYDAYKDGLRDDQDIDTRIKVATIVAKDFAGLAAPKRVNATHLHAHLSPDEIEDVKRRGLEQAAAAGLIIEQEMEAE